ncbi:hypothetical protein AVEN_149725-1 [Araneus ventricosus]|uniref:Uncharacterized protein n=1 Tax=Araneus ventricosus TaxID=182803 RepID=A0A4Y2VLQ3_ARAVE|nr:hypothetical protein AVEN_149725-1 [Araneus ventricosus]
MVWCLCSSGGVRQYLVRRARMFRYAQRSKTSVTSSIFGPAKPVSVSLQLEQTVTLSILWSGRLEMVWCLCSSNRSGDAQYHWSDGLENVPNVSAQTEKLTLSICQAGRCSGVSAALTEA